MKSSSALISASCILGQKNSLLGNLIYSLVLSFTILQASVSSLKPLQVDILTPAIYSPVLGASQVYVGPAFDLALKDIREQYPVLNITQHVIYNPAVCTCIAWNAEVDDRVAEVYYRLVKRANPPDVIALVFSGCSEVIQMARLATEWNILMLTSAGAFPPTRNRVQAPTWVTTSVISITTYAQGLINLLRKFSWTNIAIVVDVKSNPLFVDSAVFVEKILRVEGKQVESIKLDSSRTEDYSAGLARFRQGSRVCLFFGHSNTLKKLLVVADGLNMTDGSYVYIALVPFRHETLGLFRWNFREPANAVLVKPFRSLFLLEGDSNNVDTLNFMDHIELLWRNASAVLYNTTYKANETMTPHPRSTYAATMIFAQVLSHQYSTDHPEVIRQGGQLAQAFLGRTFSTILGNYSIGQLGERIPVLRLTQLDESGQFFEDVLIQDSFLLGFEELKKVYWQFGTWPIPNKPKCGYDAHFKCDLNGSALDQMGNRVIYGTSVAVLLMITAISCFARRLSTKKDVNRNELWWIVDLVRLRTTASFGFLPTYNSKFVYGTSVVAPDSNFCDLIGT